MGTSRILAALALIAAVAAVILVIADPAFALTPTPSNYRGAPGPIVGAGLVAVVVGVGAYWLFRRFRKVS
jgi:hypothetical protein